MIDIANDKELVKKCAEFLQRVQSTDDYHYYRQVVNGMVDEIHELDKKTNPNCTFEESILKTYELMEKDNGLNDRPRFKKLCMMMVAVFSLERIDLIDDIIPDCEREQYMQSIKPESFLHRRNICGIIRRNHYIF